MGLSFEELILELKRINLRASIHDGNRLIRILPEPPSLLALHG
jgi:hypothetical protein